MRYRPLSRRGQRSSVYLFLITLAVLLSGNFDLGIACVAEEIDKKAVEMAATFLSEAENAILQHESHAFYVSGELTSSNLSQSEFKFTDYHFAFIGIHDTARDRWRLISRIRQPAGTGIAAFPISVEKLRNVTEYRTWVNSTEVRPDDDSPKNSFSQMVPLFHPAQIAFQGFTSLIQKPGPLEPHIPELFLDNADHAELNAESTVLKWILPVRPSGSMRKTLSISHDRSDRDVRLTSEVSATTEKPSYSTVLISRSRWSNVADLASLPTTLALGYNPGGMGGNGRSKELHATIKWVLDVKNVNDFFCTESYGATVTFPEFDSDWLELFRAQVLRESKE